MLPHLTLELLGSLFWFEEGVGMDEDAAPRAAAAAGLCWLASWPSSDDGSLLAGCLPDCS